MINVNIGYAGEEYSLRMTGHANEGEGSPEVCAACSAIAYALAGWIDNNSEHITGTEQRILEPGNFMLLVAGDAACTAVWDMAVIGLLQIEKAHSDQVKIISEKM